MKTFLPLPSTPSRGRLPRGEDVEPFYLIYRTGLEPTNGTSIYLEKLLAGLGGHFIHILWQASEGGVRSLGTAIVADDTAPWRKLPSARARVAAARLAALGGRAWWLPRGFNRRRLARTLSRLAVRPGRAWAVCMMESDAEKVVPIWNALGRPPFVLHVMDIFHDSLSESETPRFIELVQAAGCVVAITPEIAAETRRHGARTTSVIPCASGFSRRERGFAPASPQMALSGTLWHQVYEHNRALEFLSAAWPGVVREFPGAGLHYTGMSGRDFPASLQGVFCDHGALGAADYGNLLNLCNLAYLPVTHPPNSVAKFSLPSRLADYLACGLPVLAATEEGSAVNRFLRNLPDGCAFEVRGHEDIIRAVRMFAHDAAAWRDASMAAADYARRHLSVAHARARMLGHLGGLAAEAA